MRRLALLAAFTLSASPLSAQERTPSAPGPIAESAERLAREYWPSDTTSFTIDEQGRPRFRSGVTVTQPTPPWQPSSEPEPDRVRGAISHQEMVRMMTPPEFSTPLISGSVDPGQMINGIKQAWRDWEARRIHERVMKEVEALKAAAAADSDSGSESN
ncbi:MAG TPA: hypothetical protein VH436_34750 [Vicinamibacterales bacterium]|jgi:hypothetical protein